MTRDAGRHFNTCFIEVLARHPGPARGTPIVLSVASTSVTSAGVAVVTDVGFVFHGIQQVSFAGELDQIGMGGDQGLAPVDEHFVRGE